MKMVGTLKEMAEKINNEEIKVYISCSTQIDNTGYIEINGVDTDSWWVSTGKNYTKRSFSCCPGTSVYK